MMKKKLFAALAAMFTAVLVLAGCSGAPVSKDAFLGEWQVASMTDKDGTESISQDDLKMMREWGLDITIALTDDDKCVLDLMGDKAEGTWKVVDASTIRLSIDGLADDNAKLEDGKLVMSASDGTKMTFEKKAAEDAEAEAATDAATDAETSE